LNSRFAASNPAEAGGFLRTIKSYGIDPTFFQKGIKALGPIS
jgi:hypothetical protein